LQQKKSSIYAGSGVSQTPMYLFILKGANDYERTGQQKEHDVWK